MTLYLALAILVAVVALVSVVLDRRWQARQAAKRSESTEEDKTDPAETSRITEKFQAVRDRFRGRKQAKLSDQLQAWAAANITDNEDLKNWFENLSEDGVQALTDQLSAFCSDLNLELDWLFGSTLDQDDELKAVAGRIVIAYCAACWQAAIAQGDLEAFRALQALNKAPTSKKHRELVQALYTKLVDEGLISPPSVSDVFLASEQKRLKQAVALIQEAAERDRKTFNEILKSVIAESRTTTSNGDSDEATAEAGEASLGAQDNITADAVAT